MPIKKACARRQDAPNWPSPSTAQAIILLALIIIVTRLLDFPSSSYKLTTVFDLLSHHNTEPLGNLWQPVFRPRCLVGPGIKEPAEAHRYNFRRDPSRSMVSAVLSEPFFESARPHVCLVERGRSNVNVYISTQRPAQAQTRHTSQHSNANIGKYPIVMISMLAVAPALVSRILCKLPCGRMTSMIGEFAPLQLILRVKSRDRHHQQNRKNPPHHHVLQS